MNLRMSRDTPIEDLDPSCERTEATLGIYNIDPDVVTNLMGIPPTGTRRKGVPREPPWGSRMLPGCDSWLLSSEGAVTSKDTRTHLDWLLDKLEGAAEGLGRLQGLPGVKLTIRCSYWSTTGSGGPALWPEQMARMAELDLEWTFTFAALGNSENQEPAEPRYVGSERIIQSGFEPSIPPESVRVLNEFNKVDLDSRGWQKALETLMDFENVPGSFPGAVTENGFFVHQKSHQRIASLLDFVAPRQ